MSVVKRGASPFWYMQFQLHGRTYIRSSRTQDRRVAERMENEWKAKLHARQFLGEKERISLGDALDLFVASKAGISSHRQLVSMKKTVVARVPPRTALDGLLSSDLERFKREREGEGVSQQTIKHGLNLIRGAIKFAKRLGYEAPDLLFPTTKIPKAPLHYLSEIDERRLLVALDPNREGKGLKCLQDRDSGTRQMMQDAYDLVVLLLDTGAR